MSEVRVLSASQTDTYRGCSLKWHFRYRERAPAESASGAALVGIVTDVTVKALVHALRDGATVPNLKVEEVLDAAWTAEIAAARGLPVLWGERGSADKGQATALALVKRFLELPDLAQRLSRIQAVDLRFEFPVADPTTGHEVPGLRLQGILDFVERTDNGRLRPLDLKTSASRAGWDPLELAQHLQGALYVWGLRQLHGDEAAGEVAFTIGLKTKEVAWEDRLVALEDSAIARALLTVIHADRAMRLGVAFPSPSWLCGTCPYAGACRNWQSSASARLARDPFAA